MCECVCGWVYAHSSDRGDGEWSFIQIIALFTATILLSYISKMFFSIYSVQGNWEFVVKGEQLLFLLGSIAPDTSAFILASLHPPGFQGLAIRMASSFVAFRVLSAGGTCTVLITMAMAEGMEERCGHQPLWLTPLSAPSPVHCLYAPDTVFCSVKLLISLK